jgi:hypothetical protein
MGGTGALRKAAPEPRFRAEKAGQLWVSVLPGAGQAQEWLQAFKGG